VTIVGAQDFQSGEQWQSQLLMNVSLFFAAPGNHTWPDTGPAAMAVANWQGLQFKASAASGCDYVVRWWSDQFKSQQLGERRFTISTNFNDTYLTLPNLGPYFNIQATNGAAGANTASFVITGTNRVTGPFQPGSSFPMIQVNTFTLGATTTSRRFASYLYAGPAHLETWTSSASWDMQLYARQSNDADLFLGFWSSNENLAAGFRHVQLILPPLPVNLFVNNWGGAAADFELALTPDVFR